MGEALSHKAIPRLSVSFARRRSVRVVEVEAVGGVRATLRTHAGYRARYSGHKEIRQLLLNDHRLRSECAGARDVPLPAIFVQIPLSGFEFHGFSLASSRSLRWRRRNSLASVSIVAKTWPHALHFRRRRMFSPLFRVEST